MTSFLEGSTTTWRRGTAIKDKREGSNRVSFFSLGVEGDRHCVNFPLLASVLAGLQEENSKFQWATVLSAIALLISIVVPLAGMLLSK